MALEPEQEPLYEPAGLLWAWWRGDVLPTLPLLADFTVDGSATDHEVAQVVQLSIDEVGMLRQAGLSPYLARWETHVVGYGWSATKRSVFGSPPVAFTIPTAVRYLRDFATFPAWRGRGVYPRLLQAIMVREGCDADQFWILHQWANHASARGIAKAGFGVVGQICFLPSGGLGIIPTESYERAEAGAALLGLPLVHSRANQ